MIDISSAKNPKYKTWLRLQDARGVKKHEQALIAGRKIIGEVLTLFPERVLGVIVKKESGAERLRTPETCPVYCLPHDLFAAVDIYGINGPVLVVSAPPLPAWNGELAPGMTIFLPFQNPINLGTTIRSAAALGASVVLLREAATPYLPKSLRASGPAIFQTPVFQGPSLRELAEFTHLPIFALSPKGESVYARRLPETVGFVAGMEGPGLDEHWPEERRLTIPMRANVESLNAAVAIGIAMACRNAASAADPFVAQPDATENGRLRRDC